MAGTKKGEGGGGGEGGGRKARKREKGKGTPAIRAGVFVFRPPISLTNPITSIDNIRIHRRSWD